MKIKPQNEFLLLEIYEFPKAEGSIILPYAPQNSLLYKVIDGYVENGQLVYLKCNPRTITLPNKTYYIADAKDVMATVELEDEPKISNALQNLQ